MDTDNTKVADLSRKIKYACAWMPIGSIRRSMRQVLKNIISSFEVLQNELEVMQSENKLLKSLIESEFEVLQSENKLLKSLIESELTAIKGNLLHLGNTINCKKKFYANSGEKEFIDKNFTSFNPHDSRIMQLLKGLDCDSAEIVCKIIRRIDKIKTSPLPIDLYTKEEQENIKDLIVNYRASILSLENDVYVYQNKFLPMNRFFVSIFHNGFHGISKLSQQTIEKINTGTILDVGGFMGDSCLRFRDFFPDSPMYSFECLPENIQLFKRTIELNNMQKVYIVEKALSDEVGISYFSTTLSSSHLCESEAEGNVEVSTDTLDNWLESNPIEKITMIKVDIEGAEQKFLAGARKTIEKHRPILLLSIYHNWEDFLLIKPILESWNLNYSFKIFIAKDINILVDTMLVCEPM